MCVGNKKKVINEKLGLNVGIFKFYGLQQMILGPNKRFVNIKVFLINICITIFRINQIIDFGFIFPLFGTEKKNNNTKKIIYSFCCKIVNYKTLRKYIFLTQIYCILEIF